MMPKKPMPRCDQTPDMFPEPPQFGTEPRKLVRRYDPGTSVNAACKIDTTKGERRVYETILSFGPSGCISDEVLQKHPECAYSTITARYKGLEDKCLIYYLGDERTGNSKRPQRVMRANPT